MAISYHEGWSLKYVDRNGSSHGIIMMKIPTLQVAQEMLKQRQQLKLQKMTRKTNLLLPLMMQP